MRLVMDWWVARLPQHPDQNRKSPRKALRRGIPGITLGKVDRY